MTLAIEPGIITMTVYQEDLHKGLNFLKEIVMHASFDTKAKKSAWTDYFDLLVYWDDPQEFSNYLIRKELYQNHPMAKILMERLNLLKITQADCLSWYKSFLFLKGASCACW